LGIQNSDIHIVDVDIIEVLYLNDYGENCLQFYVDKKEQHN